MNKLKKYENEVAADESFEQNLKPKYKSKSRSKSPVRIVS